MDYMKVVKARWESLPINNDFEISITNVLSQINIIIKDENNNYKLIDNVLDEVRKSFKILSRQNRIDYDEIRDKYIKTDDNNYVISEIHCYDRNLIEERIKHRNIIMYYVCNKLAGIREGMNLYSYIINKI